VSHGPKREPGLDSAATARLAASLQKPDLPPREDRRWRDLFELACWISERAHAGKRVVLSPTTAHVVAAQLSVAHARPTRNEVALMICRRQCEVPCYECTGRANVIVHAYGARLDDPRPKGSE
jgi:hypothetical protein